MGFESFRALRQRVRRWLSGLWQRAPRAVDDDAPAAGRVRSAWVRFPKKLASMIWYCITATLQFAWRVLAGIARWLSRLVVRPVWRALLLVIVAAFLAIIVAWLVLGFLIYYPSSQVEAEQPAHMIYYLDQGWGPNQTSEKRQTFYYTPQGTSLLATGFRYSWLIHLEQAGMAKPFARPEHMRALGFLVDNVPTAQNPDSLPVGFTRHFAPEFNDDVVDITCAACHTGELHVRVKGQDAGIRIDGGQAMHAFTSTATGQFGPALTTAMGATLLNPFKFIRFARGVLGDRYPAGRAALAWNFSKVLYSLVSQTADDVFHDRYPVEEGFGRTDAIGRIANRAFGTDLDSSNFAPGNAPVSFPAIWDAHYWDWVQYTASVAQPMARNVGESLGVGATLELVDDYGRPLPESARFVNGTLIRNLKTIEDTIADLKPPVWPEDLLGDVHHDKADKGKSLFEAHCAGCHEPCLLPDSEVYVQRPLLVSGKYKAALWHIDTVDVDDIGTDPQAAMNFVNRKINLEKTGLTREEVIARMRPILEEEQQRRRDWAAAHHEKDPGPGEAAIQSKLDQVTITSANIGQALNFFDIFIQGKYYKELGITDQTNPQDAALERMEYDGDGALDTPLVRMVYKPRPLGGVWATGPYLHNGSVPTLYDLLSPANERPRKFFIGNRMDFDPVRVGLVASPASDKGFWYDTTIPGNRNGGHEFRAGYSQWKEGSPPSHGVIGPELKPEERWDIIEYLKIYRENPPPCKPDAPAPAQGQPK